MHPETKRELVERYGERANVAFYEADVDDGIVHAFCVRHSVGFADITAAQLKRLRQT